VVTAGAIAAVAGPLLSAATAVAEAAKRDPEVARRLAEERIRTRRAAELRRAIGRWARARSAYISALNKGWDKAPVTSPRYEDFAIAEGRLNLAVLLLADVLDPALVDKAVVLRDALDNLTREAPACET
jgi:hypothetical protein